MKNCPNCSATLTDSFRYCPQCGQTAHLHRFNMAHIGHEVFHAFTHADKGVLYLIKNLSVRPGVVAREYVLEGKRKKYFNPFTFLLLVLGFLVFVNTVYKPYGQAFDAPAQTQTAPETPTADEQAQQQRNEQVVAFLNQKSNLIAFAALPLFTLVFWLFFFRRNINYAEHLVANIFFAGYFQLFTAVLTLGLGLLHIHTSTIYLVQLGFQVVYLTVAYYQFLNYQKPQHYLRTLAASVLAILAWMVVSFLAIGLYVSYGA